MFESVNIVAVLGITLFMLASATVWYSPMLFGSLWLKELRVTEKEIEASRKNVITHLVLLGVGYAFSLSMIATLVSHFGRGSQVLQEMAMSITLLVVAMIATTVLWENRSWRYFLINAGFAVYLIVIGVYMLAYWPW